MRMYLGGPFPYQGINGECNHTLAGVGACTAAEQVYLIIPMVYGQIQW